MTPHVSPAKPQGDCPTLAHHRRVNLTSTTATQAISPHQHHKHTLPTISTEYNALQTSESPVPSFPASAMITVTADSLPWLAKPSTGYDLFSKPPEKPTAYPSLLSDDEETVGPKRIIASRGTEIFVGKGNEVRCADLQDLKARQPTSAQEGYRQYKVRKLSCGRLLFRYCLVPAFGWVRIGS